LYSFFFSYKSIYMQTQNNNIILLIITTTIILLFLLSFIAAVLFLYQKKNVLYYKQLEDVKNIYDKNLLQTQLEIQEQTFQDISREIHDNIGLSLTLAKLQLNTIDYVNSSKTTDNVDSSINLIGKAIQDLSDISKSLNSEVIKNLGLYNTLKLEIEKIARSGKHIIEFMEEGDIAFLDAQKELILYRIAQEALNNILKHSSASHIWIKLTYGITQVNLSIEDNGAGFDKTEAGKQRSGINSGLTNMRTRATMLNGSFNISSSTGNGTKIYITAPY
jgi:two-component system, NarL family, sensor kinase